MEPAQFFAESRVLIVAGKGGVGKTTVSAAMARAAALAGLTTLVVEVEGRSGLASLFGQPPFDYHEVTLAPGGGPDGAADVRARTLTPDEALLEYLEAHGMWRLSKRLVGAGALDVVATAAPGVKDILVLGKVKQLERAARSGSGGEGGGPADLIVLDAPAAGHAITFLRSARGLMDAVRSGPIQTQAADVLQMLTDPERCEVILVTLPEETPVNELVETAFSLEEDVGVSLGPVVVNDLYDPVEGLDVDPVEAARSAGVSLDPAEAEALRDAARFRSDRMELQAAQVERLAEALPLPQIHLPHRFTADLGRDDIEVLAHSFTAGIKALAPS